MDMIHQIRKAVKMKKKHDNNYGAASLGHVQRYLCQWTEYFNAE